MKEDKRDLIAMIRRRIIMLASGKNPNDEFQIAKDIQDLSVKLVDALNPAEQGGQPQN